MTQPLDVAQSPAFAVPPHLLDDSGAIAVWFTDPPGAVLQFTRPERGTTELAKWLCGDGYEQLLRRFPDGEKLRFVLDMRQMTGRAATARSVLIEHGKLVAQRVGPVIILPSMHLGPFYVTVVEGTALMLRAFGLRIDVDHSLERALSKQEMRLAPVLDVARPAINVRSAAGTGRAQL